MYETIELERRGAAVTIRLNRPEALNAWNEQLGTELLDAVRDLAEDDAVRAVCITGAGRAFSAGGDVREMSARALSSGGELDVYTTLTTIYHPILLTIRTMPKPVVAAINGPAVGIGCSLALSCDILIAAESAYMSLGFANIGLVPDGGAMALICARAGAGRAAEMAMLPERVPASKVRRWSIVNEVLPNHELLDLVNERLDHLVAGPTQAYAATKRQINAWSYADLERQLELEARMQQEMVQTADFREGVAAFLEKRPPKFKGS